MSGTVRFQLEGGSNPLILVHAEVNDAGPFRFVLDTGAGLCVLSPRVAAHLGVEAYAEKHGMGAGGPVKLSFARLGSLSVGSTREHSVEVLITDELDRIGAAIGARVDGAIGFNFLKGSRLTLDYRKNLLGLARPSEGGDGHRARGATSVPFTIAAPSKPLILVPAFVEGQGPFAFAVDTGASSTMLAPGIAQRLGMKTVEVVSATGGGGQVPISAGGVRSLSLGDACVRDLAVGVGEFLNMLSAAIGARLDGILGHNFLSQFQVTIDYPRALLELAPAADLPGEDVGRPVREMVS